MPFGRAWFRIRNSISAFANTPGISLALVVTIAIGVGSNAAVGGFLAGLAHPKSPVGTSGRIVSIFAHDRTSDAGPLSDSQYQAIRSRAAEFAWVNAVRIAPLDIDINGHSATVAVAAVMPDLAQALNLELRGGVVLSDHLWETEFCDENRGVARPVGVNNAQLPITGVAPKTLEGVYGDRPIDVWMPFEDGAGQDANPDRRDLWAFGSLRPGVSLPDAQREIRAALKTSDGVEVVPYSGTVPRTARGLASIVTLLNFMAGSVFLISCINVASLLLGRAFQRSSETSLRVALGATRRALSGELFSDSVVIAVAGGILGLLLAMAAKRVLPSLLFEQDADRLVFVPPVASLITSSIVCVSITVLAGMMPILATVTDRPWTVLQREQGFSSTKVVRLRAALVVLQIALCCALVIFATLLLEGFHNALKTGIGQKLGNPILVTIGRSPLLGFPADYFKAVEQSAKSVANAVPLAWTTQVPGSRPIWQLFRIQPASMPLHEVDFDIREFTRDKGGQPDMQATAGRLFKERDESCRVGVVDAAAAGALSGPATAGEKIADRAGNPVEIVGVVKRTSEDFRSRRPTIYFDPLSAIAYASMKGAPFRAPAALSSAAVELNVNYVSSSYLQAFGLSLISGHWFQDREQFSDVCRPVAVINQEAADLYFGGKPLGAGIIDQDDNQTEIIGVIRSQDLGIFQQHAEPAVFFPMWQEYPLRMTLILRASHLSDRDVAELRREIKSVPGDDTASPGITTLDTQLARSAFAPLRIATLIALASALAALTVSMIGVFSIQSHVDRERRKVLALHLAFGAQGWRILLKSLIDSGRLVFVGCVAGTLFSIALQRILLSGTALMGQPPVRAWLLALLLPALAVLISGALSALRSLSVHPMAIMRDR
jgi:ABC-type antimicrobial peptide transport system permease subunit